MCLAHRPDRPARPTRRAALGGLLGASAAAALAGCSGSSDRVTAASTSPGTGSSSGSSSASPTPSSSPTSASARQIAARATVPVLCYHQVRPWEGGDSEYNRTMLICEPRAFEEHLDAIVDGGWTTISPAQYREHLLTGGGLPDRPVIISLDDGKDNQATVALPAIAERDLTATFFPMTVVLGQPGWMTKKQVRDIADAGMTIGSHTWDHPPMSQVTAEKDLVTQLDEPRALLQDLSGQEVLDLAYPFGVWTKKVLPRVAEAGYATAYQLDAEPLDPTRPQLTLRRQLAVSTWSGEDLLERLEELA